jgi:serine/threonine protein kinase
VYEGKSIDDRHMAIKKMLIENIEIAKTEISAAVRLEHENIVTFYNREEDEERKYIYLGLGYCEGTLKDIILARSKME